MIELGEQVGDGVRAVVYRIGDDRVIKLAKPDTATTWIRHEARFGEIVHRSGAPSPAGSTIVEVQGGVGLMSAYVPGPTLWAALIDDPDRGAELGQLLAHVQRTVFAMPPTFALPAVNDRLRAKLFSVGNQLDLDLEPVGAWIEQTRDVGLCHGDLHPYNMILSPDGPVLVDWFDVGIGPMAAEIARTVLLLDERPPVDGAAELKQGYLDAVWSEGDLSADEFDRWMVVQRTARLAEGFDHDFAQLRDQIDGITWL